MSSSIGDNIKISVFGESHGEAIGCVIDGLPSGVKLDTDKIYKDMSRRAPGKDKTATPRLEKDIPHILSGVLDGVTTGAPLAMVIENTNTKSGDYSNLMTVPRPSHSDYPAYVKYNGFNDIRGGGHFSGRLTAPIVFAGAVAKQILAEKGIPVGVGANNFDTVESKLASLLFGIPAVKGVQFGLGFDFADKNASNVNDEYEIKDGKVATLSNNNGGVLGGMTDGAPIVVSVAIKPTPSIASKQRSVNLQTMENAELEIKGRHDPCIVPRAVPVVEAAVAIGLLDLMM